MAKKKKDWTEFSSIAAQETDEAFIFEDYLFPLTKNGDQHPDLVLLGEGMALIYKSDI